MNNLKKTFQDIHYNRIHANFILSSMLSLCEFFYKNVINFKNYLYKKNILKEEKLNPYIICVGNLTTGGVGKTPFVSYLADFYSKDNNVAIISRGYGAKLSNKIPRVIKDKDGIKFENGALCADEPYQLAKNTPDNVAVITCKDRKKAINYAVLKYSSNIIILDDGFSNRKVKKDKTYLLIDSKMRFGNNHLLPLGPLREPVDEINRADEIVLINKADENFEEAKLWANQFNKPIKYAAMKPKRIYNLQTKADIINFNKAIAFCAIGQSKQFFDFAKKYYDLSDAVSYPDHHKYTKSDIKSLIKIAKKNKINTFITTQKDETKLYPLVEDITNFSFNVLELEIEVS